MGFKTLSLTAVGAAALVAPPTQTGTPLTVRHGIFDGVKEAFSQETTILDEDRVTPFDRWLGIDVRSDESQGQAEAFAVPDDSTAPDSTCSWSSDLRTFSASASSWIFWRSRRPRASCSVFSAS